MTTVVHTSPAWFALIVVIVAPLLGFFYGRMAWRDELPRLAVAILVGLVVCESVFEIAHKIEAWFWP